MKQQPRFTIAGMSLCIFIFLAGFVVGWQNRNSAWDSELELAADEIAASKSAMYVPEFRGVVYLQLPSEPTESGEELMRRIRQRK